MITLEEDFKHHPTNSLGTLSLVDRTEQLRLGKIVTGMRHFFNNPGRGNATLRGDRRVANPLDIMQQHGSPRVRCAVRSTIPLLGNASRWWAINHPAATCKGCAQHQQ